MHNDVEDDVLAFRRGQKGIGVGKSDERPVVGLDDEVRVAQRLEPRIEELGIMMEQDKCASKDVMHPAGLHPLKMGDAA